MHLKSIPSGSWGLAKIPAALLKKSMDRCGSSGVWGDAPAANDFGALFV